MDITRAEHLKARAAQLRDQADAAEREAAALRRPAPTPYDRTPEGFAVLHGGNGIRDGSFTLFADGAQHEGDYNYYRLHQPPADDYERLTLRRRYHELAAGVAKRHAEALQRAMLGEVLGGYHLPDGIRKLFDIPAEDLADRTGLPLLRTLFKAALKHVEATNAIDAELNAHPRTIEARRRAERERDQAAFVARERMEFEREVRSLTLTLPGEAETK